ncbi:BnaC03g14410D [Brassica napus]|uniref:Hexosyltransferase n=1 Tax=Brassica napus TaxID=3708 RepID=A0A078I3V1_BRANA|nr:BnaC03g14410D [Brassica napus]
MSKKFKSYLNFSKPRNFDPEECAWAYGMNVFDLAAWRKTNISSTYYHWLDENLKSDLSLWQLGTLPPGLIAFHGHVQTIDPFGICLVSDTKRPQASPMLKVQLFCHIRASY